MSDYESLVELAAKGMAERDSHPMPRSVTTPEAFYEVMARAALDAVGLQGLLEELAGSAQKFDDADEGPILAVETDAITTPPEEPCVSSGYLPCVPKVTPVGSENGVLPTPARPGRGTRKAEGARLRR